MMGTQPTHPKGLISIFGFLSLQRQEEKANGRVSAAGPAL
jgi:hypothetical protein